MKVLVVDDKEVVRGHLVELLCEAEGVSLVATAQDLAGALDTSRRIGPDLTLARFELPDGNALDFLRASRDLPDTPATIVLDDDPGEAHAAHCAAEGAHAYLTREQAGERLAPLIAPYTKPLTARPGGPVLHPIDEVARLHELESLELLGTPREEALDNIARLAATGCRAPIAMISLVDGERAWAKAVVGVKLRELPRNLAPCQHVVASGAALRVDDTGADPRFRSNPLVHATPPFAAYAGVPLRTRAGHTLGALCAIDCVPRGFDDAQIETLERLADLVVAHIDTRSQLRALASETAMLERRVRGYERAARAHQSLTDAIDGVVWECEADTLACVAVSRGIERLFGLERQAWLERPLAWQDMLGSDEHRRVLAAFHAARASGAAQPLAFCMDGSHGRRVFLRGEVQAIDDGQGRRRLRAVTIDVTEARESATYIADLLVRYERAMQALAQRNEAPPPA